MTTDDKPAKGMKVVDRGVEDGIEWITAEAPIYGAINGYARVPEGHPWHGLDYDAIDDVQINGGLTYSSNGWIGFDTLHSHDRWPGMPRGWRDDDHGISWTRDLVAMEATSLAAQIAVAARRSKRDES